MATGYVKKLGAGEAFDHKSITAVKDIIKAPGNEQAAARLLLEWGANVNKTTLRGDTALNFAIKCGELRLSRRTRRGFFAPRLGKTKRFIGLIRLLLDSGADINARYRFATPPLHLVAQLEEKKPLELSIRQELMLML